MVQDIDYECFCLAPGDFAGRYELSEPAIRNGRLYCTNGRIALRLDEAPPVAKESSDFPQSAFDLLDGITPGDDGIPCPEVEGPPEGADKWWYAHRKEKCDLCRGAGNCECRCGDEHDCCECEGTGFVKYDGPVDGATKGIFVGEREFQRRYLWMISQLPNARLYPDRCADIPNKHTKAMGMPFSFDGGVGVVMPFADMR